MWGNERVVSGRIFFLQGSGGRCQDEFFSARKIVGGGAVERCLTVGEQREPAVGCWCMFWASKRSNEVIRPLRGRPFSRLVLQVRFAHPQLSMVSRLRRFFFSSGKIRLFSARKSVARVAMDKFPPGNWLPASR